MDWAACEYDIYLRLNIADCCGAPVHARKRGAPWWKSFTTGKSAEQLGGIPHDTYGMTTLSVRQYVTGLYKAYGLNEKEITKIQTGGPDGDLGSSTSDEASLVNAYG